MFFSESTSRFRLIALNCYMLLHQGWLNDNLLLTFHKSDFDTSDLIKRLADYDARSEAVAWCSFFFKSTLISVIVNILVMDDSHSESTYNLQGILYKFIGYNCNKVCTGERDNISVVNYSLYMIWLLVYKVRILTSEFAREHTLSHIVKANLI